MNKAEKPGLKSSTFQFSGKEPVQNEDIRAIIETHRPKMAAVLQQAREYVAGQREAIGHIKDPVLKASAIRILKEP